MDPFFFAVQKCNFAVVKRLGQFGSRSAILETQKKKRANSYLRLNVPFVVVSATFPTGLSHPSENVNKETVFVRFPKLSTFNELKRERLSPKSIKHEIPVFTGDEAFSIKVRLISISSETRESNQTIILQSTDASKDRSEGRGDRSTNRRMQAKKQRIDG